MTSAVDGTPLTRPTRFVLRMAVFLVAVGVVIGVLSPLLVPAFLANPALNGLILAVAAFGIGFIFRQVLTLNREVGWLESWRSGVPIDEEPPRRLAPMAALLGENRGRLSLSALSMRSVLDGIGARLEESRDIARYLVGLLIFLGLLGTFYGLLQTVSSVADVIGSLEVVADDVGVMFEDLKGNLAAPLSGMSTAFSSSLFGLAAALVLGFLDLQAASAQNRFFNDLEEWLASVTRFAAPAEGGGGGAPPPQSAPAYLTALVEQTAEGLQGLERSLSRAEDGRRGIATALSDLEDRLAGLTDQMRSQHGVLVQLADTQADLKPVLQRLADQTGGGQDDATREHIRNIDRHLRGLIEDAATGRAETVQDIRAEIRLLARTIAALAEEER